MASRWEKTKQDWKSFQCYDAEITLSRKQRLKRSKYAENLRQQTNKKLISRAGLENSSELRVWLSKTWNDISKII